MYLQLKFNDQQPFEPPNRTPCISLLTIVFVMVEHCTWVVRQLEWLGRFVRVQRSPYNIQNSRSDETEGMLICLSSLKRLCSTC